jgi:hypothetical protein
VYCASSGVLAVSLTVLVILRWPHTVHLLVIGAVSFAAATVGVLARRHRWSRWVQVHGTVMGTSYIALLTGFLVDNGPLLPVWRELPHPLHWTLPTMVGVPLLVLAQVRYTRAAGRAMSRKAGWSGES